MAAAAGAVVSGTGNVFGLTIAVSKLRLWMDLTRRRIDSHNALLSGFAQETITTLRSIGFKKWAAFWHYGRQLISLQERLLLEQVYSDMGKPWSSLLTGFGPLARLSPRREEVDSAARYRARKEAEAKEVALQVTKRTTTYRRERSRRQRTQTRARRQRARRGALG